MGNMESTITTKKYQSLSKGLGTAGIILEIMTLIFSLIPILGMLAIFLGFIALMICATGIGIAVKHEHSKSRLITALVLTGIGIGLSLMQFSAFA